MEIIEIFGNDLFCWMCFLSLLVFSFSFFSVEMRGFFSIEIILRFSTPMLYPLDNLIVIRALFGDWMKIPENSSFLVLTIMKSWGFIDASIEEGLAIFWDMAGSLK